MLTRAADMLERAVLAPAAMRADLAGPRLAAHRMYAAAEVIARAADLCCQSAELSTTTNAAGGCPENAPSKSSPR